jgi:hypothetical protein
MPVGGQDENMRHVHHRLLRRTVLLFITGLLLMPGVAYSQAWSGIIDPSRAVDWSQVGVYGGIPTTWPNCTTAACNTLSGGTVNDTSIANAIASAPNQSVVVFPAGSFTISAFSVGRDNVILRGQGANKTKLIFSGTTGCTSGGGGYTAAICISGTFNWSGGIQNQATWTAGFAKGTTVITLSNTANLSVGGMIILSQNKDSSGYPTSTDILVCDVSASCTTEGASPVGLGGQTAFYRVQAVNGNQVTIYPPLQAPNWRLSQSPLAWWPTHAATGVGVENMSLDISAGSGSRSGIIWENAIGNWVQGIRSVITAPDGARGIHVHHYLAAQNIIRSSYFWGYRDTAQENYAISVGGGSLLENNIVEQYVVPIIDNGPGSNGFVIAYNYITNGVGINGIPGWTQGIFYHNISDFMSLVEGNDTPKINQDAIHGTHNFFTLFRNFAYGQLNQSSNSQLIDVKTRSRFGNAIGNVLGRVGYYNTYETIQANSDMGIYGLGGPYNAATSDPNVAVTFMRWGNYDTVTGTARFVNSEVPNGIANYGNPVPASQTLPASFYLAGKPSWWNSPSGTPPYPAIGPDVSGGNLLGYAGHAYKIPARLCYENSSIDPAYGALNIKVFNANTCYASSGPPPVAPFIMSVVVN